MVWRRVFFQLTNMNRDLPVPVGQTQNAVTKGAKSVEFARRPMVIEEGATRVVVAFFGVSSVALLLFDSSSLALLTSRLYLISFSTAFTELVIFHPPSSLKSSLTCTWLSTPSELYQLNVYG